jgi:hypothetical protein
VWNPNPLILVFGLLAAPQAWSAWKARHSEDGRAYYAVPVAQRWEWGFYYLALAGFLAVMTHDVHEMLGNR